MSDTFPSTKSLLEAAKITQQIEALRARLSAIFGSGQTSSAKPAPKRVRRGKRKMSPEARARIAEAQRARWAKQKGTSARSGSSAAAPAKRKVSAAARARMAEAARRRWAARRAQG